MKKLLLTIIATICTVAGFAQDIAYKTLTFSAETNSKAVTSYTNTWSGTVGGFTWDIVNFNNNNGWNYVKCGAKQTEGTATITTQGPIDKAISKVELTIDALTTSHIKSITLYTSETNDFSSPRETVDITKDKGTQTAALTDPDENLYYQLVFSYNNTTKTNGSLTLSKVVYYTAGSGETKTPTSLTFSETSVTYDMASGGTFTAPTLTTDPADLTGITYTSSDPTVATVNETTGAVTILAKGTTTITATFAETATHYGSNATYTLKVKDTTVTPGYFNFVDWAFPGAEDWTTSYTTRTAAYTEATVTFTSANKQNAGQVIDDCPVTKGQPVTVTLTDLGNDIESFSANFKKWNTVAQTVTLYTSADGVNFTATDITTSTFAFTTTTLEKGVKAIQFKFSDDSQIGIADITIKEVKGQGKIPTNLAFSETEVTYIKASASPFVAPTLTTTPEGLTGITYTSSDPTVATVDNDGAVTILAIGTTTITATFNETATHLGSTASYTLNVTKTPTSLTFSQTSVTFNMASEDPFVAPTLTTDPATLTGITYTSSDPTVATVNEDGDVSILAEGTTTITATFAENDQYLGSTASYTLTVTASKGTETVELNLVNCWDFEGAENWTNSYAAHNVEFSKATVQFTASKQTSTITDCPVTRGKDGGVIVALKNSGTSEIRKFSATFKQWGTKAQTVTLWTSTDGENYTATTTTTSNFAFAKTTLDSGVKAIKFTFSNSSNQIGIQNVTLEILSDTTPVSTIEAVRTSDNRIYNLAGQRVTDTKSGLYIINGKKVIIK